MTLLKQFDAACSKYPLKLIVWLGEIAWPCILVYWIFTNGGCSPHHIPAPDADSEGRRIVTLYSGGQPARRWDAFDVAIQNDAHGVNFIDENTNRNVVVTGGAVVIEFRKESSSGDSD